jgi:hypothetical protein
VPQNFNPKVPTLWGWYQEAGLLTCLNEISALIAILGTSAVKLIPGLPDDSGLKYGMLL